MTTRLLAVEWDRREVRVVVADAVGRRCTIVDSFVLAHAADTEMGPAQVSESGSRLAQMLSARDVRCRDVLVVTGRMGTELRILTVPPAPEHELPALVRFQAMRQFSNLDDNSPLDYFPLPLADEADETRRVLAATVSPKVVDQVQAWCRAAGLKPQRLLLRPCTLASWWRSSKGINKKSRSVQLLVRLVADEADLVVLQGGEILAMRSVRMLEADPVTTDGCSLASRWCDLLLPEIRRTLGAIDHHDTGEAAAGAVTLCGDLEVVTALKHRLEAELGWSVDFLGLDPSSASTTAASGPAVMAGAVVVAPHAVRFAPLYGALQDEASKRQPEIDFINPRRIPPPASHRRRWIGAGAAALLMLAIGTGYVRQELARLDRQIVTLTARSKSLDQAVSLSSGLNAQAKQLNRWAAQDINWLEELWHMSKSLPEPGQVRVTELDMEAARDQGGGSAVLKAMASQSEQIAATENSLRDAHHVVRSEGGTFNKKSPDEKYPWEFRINMDITGTAP